MTFLLDFNVILAYTAAAVILVVTPGPDMTLFLGQTLTGGRARGIAAYLGASAGLVVHTMLAAFGLSGVARAFGSRVRCAQDRGRRVFVVARLRRAAARR